MKVINLTTNSKIYTCNVYCLLGSWNKLSDVNTLVDAGRDPRAIQELENLNTGVGKKKVDQIIITHNHYDHTSMLQELSRFYQLKILAFSPSVPCVNRCIKDQEYIQCGDQRCEIIHIPGHSQDSICIYCPEEKLLFSGDTPLIIRKPETTYAQGFLSALYKLTLKDIKIIYPGHGDLIKNKCNTILAQSYFCVSGELDSCNL